MDPEALTKLCEELGVDESKLTDESKAKLAEAVEIVEKAAGDGDEEEGRPAGDETTRGLLDIIRDLIKERRARKSADADDEEPVEDPEVAALKARLDEQDKLLAAEREGARVAKAVGALEGARSAKRITPAAYEQALPIVEHLARTEAVHTSKSAEGEDEERPMWEHVLAALEHDAKARKAFEPLFAEKGAGGESEEEIWKHMPSDRPDDNGE